MPELNTNDELSDLDIFNEMLDRMRLYIEQRSDSSKTFLMSCEHLWRHWRTYESVAALGKDDPEILDESLAASMQRDQSDEDASTGNVGSLKSGTSGCSLCKWNNQCKEVVYQVFNNFKILYPDFVFTLDDDLYHELKLKIYRNHFEQIIIIVLDNAVKYSTDRKVHLSISLDRQSFEIAIQDFGEGISKKTSTRSLIVSIR